MLREEAAKAGGSSAPPLPASSPDLPASQAGVRSRLDLLSERVLAHAVARGDLAVAGMCVDYFPPLYRRGFQLLLEGKKASGDPELDAVLNVVFLREGTFTEEEAGVLREELAKEHFRRRREELTRAVRLAESRGDESAVRSALDELRKIPHNA